jgi:hypothetical protein
MKHTLSAILLAIAFMCGTQVLAQDSLQIVRSNWIILKKAHTDFGESVGRFVSIPTVKSCNPSLARKARSQATDLNAALASIKVIDASTIDQIQSRQDSLLTTVALLARQLQNNKSLFSKPGVKLEAKKLEYFIERLALQVHDFNYYVNEKAGISLRFKDVRL